MVFKLVHEVGNRTRWKTDGTMSLASAKLLADELEQTPGVTGLRVNPRTGSPAGRSLKRRPRRRNRRLLAIPRPRPLCRARSRPSTARSPTCRSCTSGSVCRNTFSEAFRDAAAPQRVVPDQAPWRSPPRNPSAKKGRWTLRRSRAFSSCGRFFLWDSTPRMRFLRAFPSSSRA